MKQNTSVLSLKNVEQVQEFWNANPCGAHFIKGAAFGTPDFFQRYAEFRYKSEFHLNDLVPFNQYDGKELLEIGCGLGTDGARFARNGAVYTGVDLTEAAVKATELQFDILGLSGTFNVQNAEQMVDLQNESFDLVYSHGVLHHSPSITKALSEIHRVLKPKGEIIIMLYHKHSFNYYVRILGYKRLQVLLYILLRQYLPQRWRRDDLELHYQNYASLGRSYLSVKEFPHHCADGPECPIANSYTKREVRQLFEPYFTNLRFAVAHFPIHNTIRFFPKRLEQALASRLGWYLFIYGEKK